MDLGLCLAHLLLKAFHRPDKCEHYLELIRAFWRGYGAAANFCPPQELEARGIAHLGACLLARIDGTSPVDYLPQEEKRTTVRGLGRQLLLERIGQWSQVEASVRLLLSAPGTSGK